MGLGRIIVSDQFLRRYELHTGHRVAPHPRASNVELSCRQSIYTFLRKIVVDINYWSRLIQQHFVTNNIVTHNSDPIEIVATLVERKQIRFYKLPSVGRNPLPDGRGRAYSFVGGPEIPQDNKGVEYYPIGNIEHARAFLAQLNANNEYWQVVLSENGFISEQSANERHAISEDYIAELLASNQLITYLSPYRIPRPEVTASSTTEQASNEVATLGPHTDEEPVVSKTFAFLLSS